MGAPWLLAMGLRYGYQRTTFCFGGRCFHVFVDFHCFLWKMPAVPSAFPTTCWGCLSDRFDKKNDLSLKTRMMIFDPTSMFVWDVLHCSLFVLVCFFYVSFICLFRFLGGFHFFQLSLFSYVYLIGCVSCVPSFFVFSVFFLFFVSCFSHWLLGSCFCFCCVHGS